VKQTPNKADTKKLTKLPFMINSTVVTGMASSTFLK